MVFIIEVVLYFIWILLIYICEFIFQPIQRDAEVVAEDEQVFLMKQQTQLSKAPAAGARQAVSNAGQWTNLTNPRMHLFHIPQGSIQNRNVHISVLNGELWDMAQVHSGICELGPLDRLFLLSEDWIIELPFKNRNSVIFYDQPSKHLCYNFIWMIM